MSLGAGAFSHRVQFQRRRESDDGFGNRSAEWVPLTSCWAALRPSFGREAIEHGLDLSTTIGVLTIRASRSAREIRASDRIVFTAGDWLGRTATILSIVTASSEIEMTIEEGKPS